jgi:hypothetical protein
MATSGSTDFSLNTTEIVRKACSFINAVPLGQAVPSHIYDEVVSSLNLMMKTWSAKEPPFQWTIKEKTGITIVADQASYTLGPSGADVTMEKPIKILKRSLRLRETTTEIDIPLQMFTREQYQATVTGKTSVSSSGFPYGWYYDPQRSTGTLYLIGVPDTQTAADYTLRFDYKRHIEDFDSAANDPDITQEMLETVIYNLAVRIRPLFPAIKVTDIPDVITMAAELYGAMEIWTGEDEEDLCFQPDMVDEYE